MFKITGLILISFSVIWCFNKSIFQKYCTNLFLSETINLINQMKMACILGKTYKNTFDNINFDKMLFYTEYKTYNWRFLIDDKRIMLTDTFFYQAGRRTKNAEIEFLSNAIDTITELITENKQYCNKNKKIYFISSVATVLIITIMVI